MDLHFLDKGELGQLIRAFDWSVTSLGHIIGWPQSLKTAVGIMLRSPVPIVMLWGEDGIMIYNDAYSQFAEGRHPALLGSKVREGWPEVADFNDNVMKVVLAGGTLSYRDMELTLNLRKGRPEQVWMNLDYSPILDDSGKPAGVFAVVIETTERVLAERARDKAEERLAYALEASDMVGTFDWHIPSDTFYSDARFASMFSVDPEKGEKGAPLAEYLGGVHPNDRERIRKAVAYAILTGEKYFQEYRLLGKDGSIRWVEVRGECLYDRERRPLRFPGAVVDITRLKQSEEELLDTERNLNAVLNNASVAIFRQDENRCCVYMNPAAEKLTGYTLQEIQGRTLHNIIHHTHPDGRPYSINECPIHRAFPGASQIQGEEVFIHKDGHFYPVAFTASAIHDDHGSPVGTILEARDISTEKEAHERQQLLMRELNHRVKNLFSIISSMINLSARTARDPQDFARGLQGRINALAQAHSLIRLGYTGTERATDGNTTLNQLAATILQPYKADDRPETIVLDGPPVSIGPSSATSLALILHESATNAAKYGALASSGGHLEVKWTSNADSLHLQWTETGCSIVGHPANSGFGSRLMILSIGQLQGEMEHDWEPQGLTMRLTLPLEHLAR